MHRPTHTIDTGIIDETDAPLQPTDAASGSHNGAEPERGDPGGDSGGNSGGDDPGGHAGDGVPAAVERADGSPGEQFASLTPWQIVEELDHYIIGQAAAKRAVAIALRNRWRRQQVEAELRDEILPNNIIMIGPTGVGKTEIARRLARLAGAPFIKVEASKFTEVGYVGRDVESMVRDLVDIAVNMVRGEREEDYRETAEQRTEDRLLDLLLPPVAEPSETREPGGARKFVVGRAGEIQLRDTAPSEHQVDAESASAARRRRTREKLRGLLRDGKLEDREVEIEVTESAMPMLDANALGMEGVDWNVGEMLQDMLPRKTRRRQVTVAEARRIQLSEELDKMIDMDDVVDDALYRVENMGIIFLDELDKIAGERGGHGPDVSREGVQRDLLPIVEGSTVQTKYGMVGTEHVLFIAAGAFHVSKPSDLIPELQGRFPIRVELSALDERDFVRILMEPRNALLSQYQALVATEGARLEFTEDGIREIARLAHEVNQRMENIGARRLHTVLTTLLDDVMFDLPDRQPHAAADGHPGAGDSEHDAGSGSGADGGDRSAHGADGSASAGPDAGRWIRIDGAVVRERLARIVQDEDLRRYIL